MYSLYEYNQADHMKNVREEGIEEGVTNVNALYTWLFDQGRAADVQRASKAPEYLIKLQNEYTSSKEQK